MGQVPAVAPDTPHLPANPVIAYLPDEFQKPYPFQPAVAVDVDAVFDLSDNPLGGLGLDNGDFTGPEYTIV